MNIDYDKFNKKYMYFESAKTNKYNGHRINLRYKEDDVINKCRFRTPILFSWGLQSYDKTEDEAMVNYSFPLVLYNVENGPTKRETRFMEILIEVLSECKKHLRQKSVKDTINKRQLEALTEDMSIMYENPPRAPTLYPKIIYSGKTKQFVTFFFKRCSKQDCRIDPIYSRCRVIADIIVESIYIGTAVSLQLKIMNVLLVEDLSQIRNSVFTDIPQEDAEEIQKHSDKELIDDLDERLTLATL
ncbi:early iridovirus protein [lymphocystis disease virus-China]|uniref:p31K protein n=2 Tax=Lymphocystis disease virus 2 TaxID=159183 RepID=A0A6F8X1M0_9VIRU|nr:early iridovirus protein [lymphocystis disease virus-China]AAS47818.1 early iridovirus protein [lymphocystis disease virus-China]BCB67431.1 p31K protein [Lymphocystis disease virus 2]